MARSKIAVIGANGMLGHKISQFMNLRGYQVTAFARKFPPSGFVSLSCIEWVQSPDLYKQTDKLLSMISELKPDFVINAAGAIKQKNLSENVCEALFMNSVLPRSLAHLGSALGFRLIHFSTDCVFDGNQSGGYTEGEMPNAKDFYGMSKFLGEVNSSNCLTIRTSIIGFEIQGHLGLLSWLFSLPRGSEIEGYGNAIFSGLPTIVVAQEVERIISIVPELSGIYQIASPPISKLELLNKINLAFDLGLKVRPENNFRIDRSLNDELYRQKTRTQKTDWDNLVKDLLRDWASGPYAAIYEKRRMKGDSHNAV